MPATKGFDRFNNLEDRMDWISVKDKMPEEYSTALTINTAGFQHLFDWYHGEWIRMVDLEKIYRPNRRITHWMPLPKPPKG